LVIGDAASGMTGLVKLIVGPAMQRFASSPLKVVTVTEMLGFTWDWTIESQIGHSVAQVLKQTGLPNPILIAANGMQPRLTHRLQVMRCAMQAIFCNVPLYEDFAMVFTRRLRTTRPGAPQIQPEYSTHLKRSRDGRKSQNEGSSFRKTLLRVRSI
jgi:hypothetical protein